MHMHLSGTPAELWLVLVHPVLGGFVADAAVGLLEGREVMLLLWSGFWMDFERGLYHVCVASLPCGSQPQYVV